MEYDAITSALSGAITEKKRNFKAKKADFTDPDESILKAVRDGDPEAFGALVRRYEDFVYSLVMGIVRSREMANDITQESFLRAYKSIRRFEQKSSFKTWLYRIAYNTSLAHLARENRHKEKNENETAEQIDNSFKNHSLRLTLDKIIGKLRPEYRAVILLHYYDDLKYEEIAESLDCPIGTVKIRLYRAKFELKQLWSKYALQL